MWVLSRLSIGISEVHEQVTLPSRTSPTHATRDLIHESGAHALESDCVDVHNHFLVDCNYNSTITGLGMDICVANSYIS